MSISAKKDTEIDPFTQVAALKKMLDNITIDPVEEDRLRGSVSLVEGSSGHTVSPQGLIIIRAEMYGLIDNDTANNLIVACVMNSID